MSTSTAPAPTASIAQQIEGEPIVNDMTITIATANGSGSQTSNNTLMRSIFKMGVPVYGKNMFPSNIQGLPTWFSLRVNKEGWTGRKRYADVLILLNADTAKEDLAGAQPGTVVIFEDSLGIEKDRDDLILYPVPFKKLVAECCENVKLRKLVVNMIYVGVCCELFGIDLAKAKEAMAKELKGKKKAIELNLPALDKGSEWARANLKKLDRYRIAPMNKTQGQIIITGNEASALGAVFAGCTVLTWYPITPSSSLCEAVIEYLEEFRVDKATGKKTFAHVQAEDEIASVGMAIGAGWAGARSMTATSGPGISLMSEFIGLAFYAEVPVVIGDVERVGPSTGLPTRTLQGDITQLYWCSHGDTKHIVLIPCNMKECFEFWYDAFNIAEEFQTPVFVMTDLDLGMNLWPSEPFELPKAPLNRGKVLDEAGLKNMADWGRYKDVDGDGIPYRTIPGAFEGGAYFTRGSGHDEYARYTESGAVWVRNIDRLMKKHDTARGRVPAPVIQGSGNEIGVIAFGSSDPATREAAHLLAQKGRKVDYLRIRALPFSKQVEEFIAKHKTVYIIEQNATAQMKTILLTDYPQHAGRFKSILHYDGLPIDAQTIVEKIEAGSR